MEMTKQEVIQSLDEVLTRYYGITFEEASDKQIYEACATTLRGMLIKKRIETNAVSKRQSAKRVYYLCMEFLVGKAMKNNLDNMGLTEPFRQALKEKGIELEELFELESDAGLGNGGLGRLAACYLDSLSTQNYDAMGFSIRYEYGLFRQKIVDGWQIELPDTWLPGGHVWLMPRHDEAYRVRFDGYIDEQWTGNGLHIDYRDFDEVEALPYDMMISGADSNTVSVLRLWRSGDASNFDMDSFSSGDYVRANLENTSAEMISKVLYPADNHFEGKSLRLRQQYFLVSASLQNIISNHLKTYGTLTNFSEKNVIHINDTHPSLAIPELMHLLMDDHGFSWDEAFNTTVNSVAYTNHTVLAEALEKWPEYLIEKRLPRIYMIIKELNERFCGDMWQRFPGDWDKINRMSIISKGQVHMANLAVIGSHSVNGVSELHSEILVKDVFRDFYDVMPQKFRNVTNGIAHRRWICQSNPRLSALLNECIGPGYRHDADELQKLEGFSQDAAVLDRLGQIKRANKVDFSNYVYKTTGIAPNPDSLFDVHAKRLHEYKRQLLNALHIISIYQELLENPAKDMQPRTFFFAAKAAPGYDMAKQIIKLIYFIGAEIEKNPVIREKLRVVFLENYCVTLAENLMPSADVSQQISMAGKEASGTGNMKLMINGAITIGTMDGANVEIRQAVGDENIFIFGLSDQEAERLWKDGYAPSFYYQRSPRLKQAVDRLRTGFSGAEFSNIFHYLLVGDYGVADPYMCLADFDDYISVYDSMLAAYADRPRWNKMSLMNIANAGRFAADRSIRDYAEKIWNVKPLV